MGFVEPPLVRAITQSQFNYRKKITGSDLPSSSHLLWFRLLLSQVNHSIVQEYNDDVVGSVMGFVEPPIHIPFTDTFSSITAWYKTITTC